MHNSLQRKYGLFTAISMVVGIVIGSGVFFKAQTILTKTNGDMPLGIWAWIIGGLIMLSCVLAFAVMAGMYEKVNGVVDYAEETCGGRYAYMVGWFLATIYYPTLTSVLAWVSARYVCVLFHWDIAGGECLSIGAFFLICSYALNALSPRLAGKFQVSTTIIKLIPLVLMAVVGTIYGLTHGMIVENFTTAAIVTERSIPNISPLFAAVVSTSFAYEGWIIATSINAELKNAKRNLPIALIVGSLIIIAIYIFYYIGLAGGASSSELLEDATVSFSNIFGSAVSSILMVVIVISCLGTLNGLMLGCVRGFYSLAVRGDGYRPDVLSCVDPVTNVPTNSSIAGLLMCGIWYLYFYGANLTSGWFGLFSFDSSELPIVTVYALYLPIFLRFMKRNKGLSPVKRFLLPALAMVGCLFMIVAAVFAHGVEPYLIAREAGTFSIPVVFYLIVFAVVMAIGAIPLRRRRGT